VRTSPKTDIPYLAGLVDADGCISARKQLDKRCGKHTYTTKLGVSNASQPLVDWLLTRFGGGVSLSNRGKLETRQPSWRWEISGKSAGPILIALLPFLRVKRAQAELALQFIGTIGEQGTRTTPEVKTKRDRILKEMTRMNQTGRIPT